MWSSLEHRSMPRFDSLQDQNKPPFQSGLQDLPLLPPNKYYM